MPIRSSSPAWSGRPPAISAHGGSPRGSPPFAPPAAPGRRSRATPPPTACPQPGRHLGQQRPGLRAPEHRQGDHRQGPAVGHRRGEGGVVAHAGHRALHDRGRVPSDLAIADPSSSGRARAARSIPVDAASTARTIPPNRYEPAGQPGGERRILADRPRLPRPPANPVGHRPGPRFAADRRRFAAAIPSPMSPASRQPAPGARPRGRWPPSRRRRAGRPAPGPPPAATTPSPAAPRRRAPLPTHPSPRRTTPRPARSPRTQHGGIASPASTPWSITNDDSSPHPPPASSPARISPRRRPTTPPSPPPGPSPPPSRTDPRPRSGRSLAASPSPSRPRSPPPPADPATASVHAPRLDDHPEWRVGPPTRLPDRRAQHPRPGRCQVQHPQHPERPAATTRPPPPAPPGPPPGREAQHDSSRRCSSRPLPIPARHHAREPTSPPSGSPHVRSVFHARDRATPATPILYLTSSSRNTHF